MFVVREVFRTKAGKGKEVVSMFKKGMSFMPNEGIKSRRILSDVVGAYWTIVMEMEVEQLQTFFDMFNQRTSNPEAEKAMKGYADLIESGYREIFKVE
jgi:hypothetical protein